MDGGFDRGWYDKWVFILWSNGICWVVSSSSWCYLFNGVFKKEVGWFLYSVEDFYLMLMCIVIISFERYGMFFSWL